MSLPLKYRPKDFDEVAGNKGAISLLENILEKPVKDIPKVILFIGESGTGKTTLARIMKNKFDCSDMDFHEYNAADDRGIGTIREIRSSSKNNSFTGGNKIYLLDELHMLTATAQQASLKMLEDVPAKTFFFLCTTNPEKLIRALRSRATIVETAPLNSKQMSKLIDKILKKEKIKKFPKTVKSAIIENSYGAPRDALKLLDAVSGMKKEKQMLKVVSSGIPDESGVYELCMLMLNKGTKWKQVSDAIKAITVTDPESVRRHILNIMGGILLNRGNMKAAVIIDIFSDNYFDGGKPKFIKDCFEAINT